MAVARSLRDTYNACDPVIPLPSGDPRYVDCTPVRGHEDVVSQMWKTIIWADDYTAQLFTGHRGSGKSTELLRLKDRLEQAGYVVLFFEADDDLDLNDLQCTDLFLSIARRVTGDLAEMGVPLPDTLLKDVENWFRDTLYTEEQRRAIDRELQTEAALGIGLPETFPFVARLLARVTGQIKTGSTVKTEIRQKLDPQISQLMSNLNLLLKAAYAQLWKADKKGLVLLIDNLDRIVVRDLGDGRTTHTALYVEHGDQLCGLDCHIVYTVPISLLYSDRATVVEHIFPTRHVLPMVKVHDLENQPCPEGLEYMRKMLAARADLEVVFTPEAVDFLCRYSGGHPRDLMRMVRQACVYAPGDVWPRPITLDVVKRASDQLVATYSRMIPETHYPLLARVYLHKTIKSDEAHELMLYNLSVLEYFNGLPAWHDVHPAVTQLPKFKQALDEARQELGIRT
jgi:hypothetical protein